MLQRQLRSPFHGDENPAASEFSILAREVRNRERLTAVACSTPPPARLRPLPHSKSPLDEVPPTSTTTKEAWHTGVTAATEAQARPKRAVRHVKPQRPEVSSLQERRYQRVNDVVVRVDTSSEPSRCRRYRSPNKKGTRSGWGGKNRCHRQNGAATYGHRHDASSRRNNRSSETNSEDGTFNQHCRDKHGAFDAGIEAMMLSVFRGDGKAKRGVDASAIRSLYRKRHEQEKAKAIDELRQWWRLGRSEEAPLAEATLAASLLLAASDAEDAASGTAGATRRLAAITGLHGHHLTSAIGHPGSSEDGAFDPKVEGDVISTAFFSCANTPDEEWRDTRKLDHHGGGHEQSRCRVFDGPQLYSVDWRQGRQDPSYIAGVVRDMKKALRAGQSVKMHSREHHQQKEEDSSLGQSSCSADCQLMLRTLYMQCVPVSSQCALSERCMSVSAQVVHL